jgi:hypothetical protein
MKNKGFEIASLILDAANLIIFFFSLASTSQSMPKGIVPTLSFLAIVAFSLFLGLEYFRKRDIENIKNRLAPPLSHDNIFFITALPSSNPGRKLAEVEIAENKAEWENQQQIDIQDKNARYIGWEKFLFFIGIAFMLGIVPYLLGFWHTPNYPPNNP